MPSPLHEVLVTLFRNCPTLAPGLLQARLELPVFSEARIESADLTQLQPAEYRSDVVVVLRNNDRPVLGVIIEVQLRRDPRKRMSWPAYAVNLRQRLGCNTCVLVVSPHKKVARWAELPIHLGARSVFWPLALGPDAVPWIVDQDQAMREPELAVLSAMAHGRGDTQRAVQIAIAATGASKHLDESRANLYFDIVMASLGSAAQQEFLRMDSTKNKFQSDFARHYVGIGRAEGKAEGEAKGRAATLLKQLAVKGLGPLDADTLARIENGSIEELETWAVRVLHAASLAEVFEP